MATTNRLAGRCLAVFNRLSPLFNPDSGAVVPEDLGAWDGQGMGYGAALDDQFGIDEGFWDWANSEMNWTLD